LRASTVDSSTRLPSEVCRDSTTGPRIANCALLLAGVIGKIRRVKPLEQEQRSTFRVVVRGDSGIDASLRFAGQELAATVGDISAEGIFLKLDRGPIEALRLNAKLDVEVTFEGDTILLHGVIRSEHGGGYGIFFPQRDRAGRVNPLDRFERISAHLQRTSLSQRLKVLKLPE
jgi:hypothetical protein